MAISNPKTNIQIIPAFQEEQDEAQKILFVGQKTASGTATAGALVQSIENNNEQLTLFGADSQLAAMITAAKRYNLKTRMDVIPLDDNGAAVDATGAIVFTGTNATEDGSYTVYIGSRVNQAYTLPVTNGDTPTVIGDALEALITAKTTSPVDAVNTTGSVALTAVNGGLEGNDIGIEIIGTVAGITTAVTAMSGGLTDPVLTGVFDVVSNIRYQTVVMPNDYLLQTEATDFLDDRFNPTGDKILDGVGIVTDTDTLANLKASTLAQNSQSFVTVANRLVNETLYKGSSLFELNYVIAAQFAAIRALRLTPEAPTTRFVNASAGPRDAFGGIHMATFPYHNTSFPDLPLIDNDQMWTDTERDELKDAAWTIIGNNVANNEVILDSAITRYKTDSAGNPDLSFKFLNYVDQASVVREEFHNNLKADLANARLTLGDVVDGFSMANAGKIRGYIMITYDSLTASALIPSGETARKLFLQELTIAIDEIQGEVTITMLDPVITQLRTINATMQLTFSLTS